MSAAEQCDSCRFWLAVPNKAVDGHDGPGWGWCRREPPRVSDYMAATTIIMPGFGRGPSCPEQAATVDAVADATIFPATYRNIWCGRFEERAQSLMALLAERDRLLGEFNALPNASPDEMAPVTPVERRIIDTPASGHGDLLAKALLVVGFTANGMDSDAIKVFNEAKAFGLIEYMA